MSTVKRSVKKSAHPILDEVAPFLDTFACLKFNGACSRAEEPPSPDYVQAFLATLVRVGNNRWNDSGVLEAGHVETTLEPGKYHMLWGEYLGGIAVGYQLLRPSKKRPPHLRSKVYPVFETQSGELTIMASETLTPFPLPPGVDHPTHGLYDYPFVEDYELSQLIEIVERVENFERRGAL